MRKRVLIRIVTPVVMVGFAAFSLWIGSRSSPLHISPDEVRFAYEVNDVSADLESFVIDEDSTLSLRATALTYPSQARPTWRDPESLDAIDNQQLLEIGVSEDLLEAVIGQESPVLSLLFQVKGDPPFVRAATTNVVDQRTKCRVAWNDIRIDKQPRSGEWAVVPIPIGIWHDTPVWVEIEFLSSKNTVTRPLEYDDRTGYWRTGITQTEDARLRADFTEVNSMRTSGKRVPTKMTEAYEHARTGANYVGRYGGDLPDRFCGIRLNGDDKAVIWITTGDEPLEPQTLFARPPLFTSSIGALEKWRSFSSAQPKVDFIKAEAVHYRDVRRIAFALPGLPDMPNKSDSANLFDIRIPEVSTQNPRLVAARATMTWVSSEPLVLENEVLFQNLTPYRLLCANASPGEQFHLNRNVISSNTDDTTWLTRVKQWWQRRDPNLFQ
ncbi:MAG: hypothetical protein AAF585_06695 [Verrucomicrobiota bacterium]